MFCLDHHYQLALCPLCVIWELVQHISGGFLIGASIHHDLNMEGLELLMDTTAYW